MPIWNVGSPSKAVDGPNPWRSLWHEGYVIESRGIQYRCAPACIDKSDVNVCPHRDGCRVDQSPTDPIGGRITRERIAGANDLHPFYPGREPRPGTGRLASLLREVAADDLTEHRSGPPRSASRTGDLCATGSHARKAHIFTLDKDGSQGVDPVRHLGQARIPLGVGDDHRGLGQPQRVQGSRPCSLRSPPRAPRRCVRPPARSTPTPGRWW